MLPNIYEMQTKIPFSGLLGNVRQQKRQARMGALAPTQQEELTWQTFI